MKTVWLIPSDEERRGHCPVPLLGWPGEEASSLDLNTAARENSLFMPHSLACSKGGALRRHPVSRGKATGGVVVRSGNCSRMLPVLVVDQGGLSAEAYVAKWCRTFPANREN